MRIKICGLTRQEDAVLAQYLGAWALGFIFYPQSKRFIKPDAAHGIVAAVKTPCVGVFVNQTDEALRVTKDLSLGGVQLHGDETPEECARVKKEFGGFVIKALRPETAADLGAIERYRGAADYILLDTAAQGEWGGSGKTGDWALAAKALHHGLPVILAGGLNAGNIAAAAAAVNFFAADLSSGVEKSPGVKDEEKMRALFDAAKGQAVSS